MEGQAAGEKLQLTVEEAMLTTRSDDAYTWMRTAVDKNGKIIARQAKILMNTGAYAENSPLVVEKSTNRCVGPYAIANVLIENMSLYTNTVPASSYAFPVAPKSPCRANRKSTN